MIKAVGFDLGDTLIGYKDVPSNWQGLYSEALLKVADACHIQLDSDGLHIAKEILCTYNTRINPRDAEVKADQIFTEILNAWGLEYSHYLDVTVEAFFTFFQRKSYLHQDTIDIMRYLKSKGIKIGILTDVPYGMGKGFVEKDVSPFKELIDCLLTSVEVGYRKPNPIGYERLAQGLDTLPKHMIYVGNEEKDIIGGKIAGMRTVLVDRCSKDVTFEEDYRCHCLSQLREIC